MMGGNPNNWWMSNMNHAYVLGSSIPFNSLTENPQPPPPPPPTNSSSWSQLLFSGVPGEEERLGFDHFQPKKLGSWDEQILNESSSSLCRSVVGGHDHDHDDHDVVDGIIKLEVSQSGNLYGHHGCSTNNNTEEFLQATSSSSGSPNWPHMVAMPVSSSPRSCVTSLSNSHNNINNNNNILDFTYNKPGHRKNQPPADHISECNSTASAGVCKKARVQSSSSQPPLKVRKEKLGDRITALHQLVSPFGKTDTASVLLEAIGYIRFLQSQIEALSSPYLGNSSRKMRNHQPVHGERNSVFPEDPGQLLNDSGLHKRNNITVPNQQDASEEKAKDLRSRGLCLVPVSFTQHVGSENGADYWSSAYGSGF